MTTPTQANRPIAVTTPLGPDKLLLESLAGVEQVSELFHFSLDMLAPLDTQVPFDKLLGQELTAHITLPDGTKKYFSGVAVRFSQGQQMSRRAGEPTYVKYRAELAPKFWFLQRQTNSRIFQQKSVLDILKVVMAACAPSWEVTGVFEPRDYCVQYRESDFAFASRLMEEEGIYYFFKHTAGGHQMVVANTPQSHTAVPLTPVKFHEQTSGHHEEDHIFGWEKTQEMRAGKTTLWDHCFELTGKHLETTELTLATAAMGTVTHKLKVGGSDAWERYDYPGEYAQRFDGITPGGAEQPAEVQKIFTDNKRTAKIREEQETLPALIVHGRSNVRHFVGGYKFTLKDHFNADGDYVLTRVEHTAKLEGVYAKRADSTLVYYNSFQAIPFALPFRPARATPKARVDGMQTGTVVGPAGQEIFTDKYGRVKVQFPWDREGKLNETSSCWIRVGQCWAGPKWGAIHIPRIGHEVIVDFEEGDPDRPIIIGNVYNDVNMPPYPLPDEKTKTGWKSRTTMKGAESDFNEFRFEDKKGQEDIYLHAQRDYHRVIENTEDQFVNNNQCVYVKGLVSTIVEGVPDAAKSKFGTGKECDATGVRSLFTPGEWNTSKAGFAPLTITCPTQFNNDNANKRGAQVIQGTGVALTIEKGHRATIIVDGNENFEIIKGNRVEYLDLGDETVKIKAGLRDHYINKDDTLKVDGQQSVTINKNVTFTITTGDEKHTVQLGKQALKVFGNRDVTIDTGNLTTKVSLGKIEYTAMQSITLKVGPSSIVIDNMGVTIKGPMIKIEGMAMTEVKAPLTQVKGDALLIAKGGIVMIN